MKVYVGQTRDRALLVDLARVGVGECTVRGELPPRRRPWFHDNGAFRDWTAAGSPIGLTFDDANRIFGAMRWVRDQWQIRDRALMPDFVVVPDIVAAGEESLRFSNFWRVDVADGVPAYLVVQEGMRVDVVGAALDDAAGAGFPYAGIFVGGAEVEWKTATTPAWLELARARGMRLHVGRVGVPDRVAWARELGVDSIDSCFPLFTRDRLADFLVACGLMEVT